MSYVFFILSIFYVAGTVVKIFSNDFEQDTIFIGFLALILLIPIILKTGLRPTGIFTLFYILISLVVIIPSLRYRFIANIEKEKALIVKHFLNFIFFFVGYMLLFQDIIKQTGIKIFSLGNLDPVNYAIIAKHISNYGYDRFPSLYQRDISSIALIDWASAQSLLGTLSYFVGVVPADLIYSLLAAVFIMIGISLVNSDRFINLNKTKKVVLYILTLIFLSRGVFTYIIGNGFLAQILSMYVFAHAIVLMLSKSKSKSKKVYLTLCFAATFNLYLPSFLLLVVISLIIQTGGRRGGLKVLDTSSKNFIRIIPYYLFAILMLTLFLFPGFNFLRTNVTILTDSNSPGWKCSDKSLFDFIFSEFDCSVKSDGNILIVFLFALSLFFVFMNHTLFLRNKLLAAISAILMTLILANVHFDFISYRSWKFLSILQIAFIILTIHGISRTLQNHGAYLKITASFLPLIFIFVSFQNMTTTIKERSPYFFGADDDTQWLNRAGKLSSINSIDIAVEGTQAMLIAAYINVPKINFVYDTPYYSGSGRKFIFAIQLSDNSSKLSAEEIINTKYKIIE
jgi:hypothetical protein